ncbi:hypothetical protein [Pedococcus sp. 5OH_020]|uniref:hypothetical protein n=1 Tax=Pedococcus sp. 5OH_020 TaxID=2989814 RepID=UPI0022E9BC7A|nr:hypothetical protein [Pedococcus sp. 5OH_020]
MKMISETNASTAPRRGGPALPSQSRASTLVVAMGIVASSLYALVADDPYRGLAHETALAAVAQDVFSVVVAAVLLILARRTSARAHLIRLGLLAYVAYSYTIYLIGVPMNRIFLIYVVLVITSGASFLYGLLRLRPTAWPRVANRRLERGTGWMLLVVAGLFAGLWLSALLPFALGGVAPRPPGPGGVAYPVYILDLVVVLPCIAAVGRLLLLHRPIAGPLATVALIKMVTLFAALWTGVAVTFIDHGQVTLNADAGPSLLLLLISVVVAGKWLRSLSPDEGTYIRPTLWGS